eukprot:13293967-Alexandrium_andersonii.AAC.1
MHNIAAQCSCRLVADIAQEVLHHLRQVLRSSLLENLAKRSVELAHRNSRVSARPGHLTYTYWGHNSTNRDARAFLPKTVEANNVHDLVN